MNIITLPLGPLETNCYVVFENAPGACVLVDPGAQAQSILDCLKERGLTPGLILLTHAHFDHTGALRELHAQYPDVPIYVSAQDTDETLNMSHGNLVYTDTFLDGDEISLPPLQFHAISTPGHTKGSSCFVCGNTIFSGDTLFEGCCGRTDLPGGSEKQMMASLKRLAELPTIRCCRGTVLRRRWNASGKRTSTCARRCDEAAAARSHRAVSGRTAADAAVRKRTVGICDGGI